MPRILVALIVVVESAALPPPDLEGQQPFRLDQLARATSAQLDHPGQLVDAVAGARGHLFLVDGSKQRILVTDLRLNLLGHSGKRGSGAGEFIEPISVALLANGQIAILDRALHRVSILNAGNDGVSLIPVASIELGIRIPQSMCAIGNGKLLIYGLYNDARLHVLDLKKRRLVRSLAPADDRLSPMAQSVLTQGRIACDQEQDEVLVSSKFLPEVEAFRISSGRLDWVDTLTPFRPLTLTDEGHSVTISAGHAGNSIISSLLSLNEYRVFQTVYDARQDSASVDTIITYAYSRRRQTWLPYRVNIPLLIPVGGKDALYLLDQDNEIRIGRLELGVTTPKLK
jgi:hypothetical protein